jgi:hypothetical protein
MPQMITLPIELYLPLNIIIYLNYYHGVIRTLISKYQKFMTYLLVNMIFYIVNLLFFNKKLLNVKPTYETKYGLFIIY